MRGLVRGAVLGGWLVVVVLLGHVRAKHSRRRGARRERAETVRPFISFEEDDRHQLSCEREGDKYQERDKLRVGGMIAKLDMLWRL